jgi:hypothetical protein
MCVCTFDESQWIRNDEVNFMLLDICDLETRFKGKHHGRENADKRRFKVFYFSLKSNLWDNRIIFQRNLAMKISASIEFPRQRVSRLLGTIRWHTVEARRKRPSDAEPTLAAPRKNALQQATEPAKQPASQLDAKSVKPKSQRRATPTKGIISR